MFYETAQTVGPGWHRSYRPPHYEDMSWSPSSKNFRSPGSSPETYRRIIRTEEDFPSRHKEIDDEFFSGRRSPTFPRRIFKEVWNESPSANHRFSDRPRMFKRVFKPNNWEEEFDKDDIPHLRRFEREFERFDDNRPSSRKFDDDFDRRFSARDLQKDMQDDFEKSEGRVHHIPIMVERRMEELKSKFGRNSPPPEKAHEDEYAEDWSGPQVQRLRKNFEPEEGFSSRHGHHRVPRDDSSFKPRGFSNTLQDTWDPHAIHTLPTRKLHKSSQSVDDCKHPLPPKSVYRSYSETQEDAPKSPQQHSAAFRSHSDGHCPNQTYITKIEVNLPPKKGINEQRSNQMDNQSSAESCDSRTRDGPPKLAKQKSREFPDDSSSNQSSETTKTRCRGKYDSPSLQQIAVVLQNVEDLVGRIEAYNGTGRDKQYRFLDEMLTRCMIRLDGVDTEGREDIRNARKAAIRDVQSCIDRLEAKAEESERQQQKEKAIPLADAPKEAIPLGEAPKQAIPLGDAPKEAIPLSDAPMEAIPLGDVPREAIPLGNGSATVIPLGDVPRSSSNTNQNNGHEEKSDKTKQYSRQNSGKDEQTKL
ncbi:BAG domain-containing protein Samui [Trichonephila inaurata madagascariensis]|uniref:BAG domain-containing protein Samui n=1 Tax=Trichonephila inaurata madagascariensis TaxID=2747483 RepID=A0A8X6YX36_9ARAC|nr:BAG domain-containing protein Samui [Trichonephila inaurata madagascariensis]